MISLNSSNKNSLLSKRNNSLSQEKSLMPLDIELTIYGWFWVTIKLNFINNWTSRRKC